MISGSFPILSLVLHNIELALLSAAEDRAFIFITLSV